MTHDEALDVLTAWIVVGGRGSPTSLERRAAAEDHVSCCSQCWEEISETHELITGSPPAAADRMGALFGCAAIQDELYLVAGWPPAAIEKAHPSLAQHLGWCHACRDVLTDLVEMGQLPDEGASLAEPLSPAVSWRELVVSGGDRIRELVGEVVFRLRQGVIASRTWPAGLVMVPIGAGAGAMRGGDRRRGAGDEPTAPGEAPGHGFRLDLDTIDLGVELLIESHETDRVRLEVQVLRGDRPISVALRRVEGDREQLVAAQEAAPSKKFVASNLQPGAYHLEVRDHPAGVRRRIRLLLERG